MAATIISADRPSLGSAPNPAEMPVITDAAGRRRISPTDISTFIRLDQCNRYLRLRLHERAAGLGFMRDQGLVPQELPPLLSRSGSDFELDIAAEIAAHLSTVDFATGEKRPGTDNARLTSILTDLEPGQTVALLQPSLDVELAGWVIRGAVDVIRAERKIDGALGIVIVDIKSSSAAKIEHLLQVAFYAEMLAALLADASLSSSTMSMGILYRGPALDDTRLTPEDLSRITAHGTAALDLFGVTNGLLDVVVDPQPYFDAVRDLVTGPASVARRVATERFDEVPFHLSSKCDNCLYNEFCLRDCADRDDLSLLPHLTDRDKAAFRRAGVQSVAKVATLKRLDETDRSPSLVSVPESEELVRRLSATWPVGPRLDELIHRARRYRSYKGDALEALTYIPDSGYSSLPRSTTDLNPNLVLVYLDAQVDYLEDRLYLAGALVVGHEAGLPRSERRRTVVSLCDGVPSSPEQEAALLEQWLTETITAIVEAAAPDPDGLPRAPIHLVFYDRAAQQNLLEALARHHARVMTATPLYDFVTQIAAYDSPIVSYLEAEIRAQKNYPLLAQSLQAVASWTRFDWSAGQQFRKLFRHRLFDSLGRAPGSTGRDASDGEAWYTRRARFSSQIPLEYAYAVWGELPLPPARGKDEFGLFREVSRDLLVAFEARRLEAIEHIGKDLRPNPETSLTPFALPDLATFEQKASSLAQALEEFTTIERHADLGAWKAAHLAAPERRVLNGDSLIVRYIEADQPAEIAEQNRENQRRSQRRAELLLRTDENGQPRELNPTEKAETSWSQEGLNLRLRIDLSGVDASLKEALDLTKLRPGDRVIVHPRWTVDSRRPPAEQVPLTPTAKALVYGLRATIDAITVDERDREGNPRAASVSIVLSGVRRGDARGFTFGTMSSHDRPLTEGQQYTVEGDPNDHYGGWCAKVVAELGRRGQDHTLYRRIEDPASAEVSWPVEAAATQERFFAGLEALHAAGAFHNFEASKRLYIAGCGDVPTLMVQGPPGTGKSFTTAYALLARIQAAMAADCTYRAVLSCKTHAATDVLLNNLVEARRRLTSIQATHPDIFAEYFDARLLDVPLYRVDPRGELPSEIQPLRTKHRRQKGEPKATETLQAERWCLAAATPAAVYNLVSDRWPKDLFGHGFVDALVLDEASQMNLPEAMMAALPLKSDGHLIVVGDHRQMPPIVKHDWGAEPRRTFREFRSYESLFLTLLPQMVGLGQPVIRFEESFRLHAEMAEFLRREVYRQDGIRFHSKQHRVLAPGSYTDSMIEAILKPDHPLVVLVHDEHESTQRNAFEQRLIAPVLTALSDPGSHGLDAETGLGVVVPHRAQRAALQDAVPSLTHRDDVTGRTILSAVDTIERFQGGERRVILVGATESDRAYLAVAPDFLLDPRRLTVALSRAKEKMILVASRSVFELFSADEEVFANAQLWKNLLYRTCTVPLWQGKVDGIGVAVWGNAPSSLPGNSGNGA